MVNVRRFIRGITATLSAAAIIATAAVVAVPSTPAEALSGSQFDPGNIISNQHFYDANAMSEAQIASFLQANIGTCQNANCLNVVRTTTTSRSASVMCSAYQGGSQETAARIIFKVQQACGISAKVLLVTLQKEQSLVTHRSPSLSRLDRAMGYACPDNTAIPGWCDPSYGGLYNQLYWAAWQFKRYSNPPGTALTFTWFPVGATTAVRFHPQTACGSSPVRIQNEATAALYYYTPYQPNAAALRNLYGTGDACSAYGNRNFWRMYSDWFGNPTVPPGTPEGRIESVTVGPRTVGLNGWAIDPDAPGSTVTLSIQLGSTWQVLHANQAGTSQEARFPGAGPNHNFGGSLTVGAGTHTMCIYLVNAGGMGSSSSLGCQQVVVPDNPAVQGAITAASATSSSISFSGWLARPDATQAVIPVAVSIGANWYALSTGAPTPDGAATAMPSIGATQGVTGRFPAEPGVRSFCIWASSSSGVTRSVDCRSILVPQPRSTVSDITSITGTATGVSVDGWAVWPEAGDRAVPIAVNIGANWHGFSANQPNAAATAAVPGAAGAHGFTGTIPLSPGTYNACVWAGRAGGGADQIGCRTVTVAPAATSTLQFEIQRVVPVGQAVEFSGWALWNSAMDRSVPIAVNIGSRWFGYTANQPNERTTHVVPSAVGDHGFGGSIPLSPGTHNVCFWASQLSARAMMLGCRTVTIAAPISVLGSLDIASGAAGGIHFEGWAVLPSTPEAAVSIAANVGGAWVPLTIGRENSTAPQRFVGAGANQGFGGLLPIGPGAHTLCIWAAGPAGAVNLGCRTATVSTAPAVAGAISGATGVEGGIDLRGWAVWPAALQSPVSLAANVGTTWTALPANLPSALAADFVLGAGPNQGFNSVVPAASGSREVCVWANLLTGGAQSIGCRTVAVP